MYGEVIQDSIDPTASPARARRVRPLMLSAAPAISSNTPAAILMIVGAGAGAAGSAARGLSAGIVGVLVAVAVGINVGVGNLS